MSALQREEIAQGTALTPCPVNVVIYGLRSGWREGKEKFDPQRIPRNLPMHAKKEILTDYAIYSLAYDLGDGAHQVTQNPTVRRVGYAVGTAILIAFMARYGLPAIQV